MAKSYQNFNILASGTELKNIVIGVSDERINTDALITILTSGDYDISLSPWKEKQAPNGVNAVLQGTPVSSNDEPAF